jgi:DNA modification methylase
MTEPVLQHLPIDDLLPYARNAKQHPPEQIAQIAASIKEFGFNAPVLVDGEQGIIAGHGRVLAARKLGLATVPCLVLTHLTPAQKRAYIIADNRLGDTDLAPWDWEMLQAEMDQLKEENYDYTLTGFTDESLAAAVAAAAAEFQVDPEESGRDTEPQTDRAEELRVKWDVNPGDLWQLGEHRLLCGDSTKTEDVARVMGGELASLVVTDPPYGMSLDTDYSKMPSTKQEGNKTYKPIIGDDKPFDYCSVAHLETAEAFWFGADYYAKSLPDGGSWLVWDKRVEDKFDAMIGSAFELAWSKANHKREIIRCNNTLFSGEPEARNKLHPTQKPTKVIAWIIEKYSRDSSVVVDYFSGSGTTIIACENLGRKCRAIEISPGYVGVTLERYFQHTGQAPTRIHA